jgi:hypothetical protein
VIWYASGETPDFDEATWPGWWFNNPVSTLLAERPAAQQSGGLTGFDRCDACNAQAYVLVTLAAGELMFCAHHARAHAPAYKEIAVSILDESDKLSARISIG